jgi:hypothetical protein
MRFIHPSVHGALDYVLVAALVLVSIAVGLSGLAAAIAYLMAAALLVTTLVTAFPFPSGTLKLLPLPTHSRVELSMGMGLLVCPWVFGFADEPMALNVFLVSGFALLLLHLFSKLD